MKWLGLAVGIFTFLLLRVFFRIYQLKKMGREFKFYKINWFWFWAMFMAYYTIAVVVVLFYRLLVWSLS